MKRKWVMGLSVVVAVCVVAAVGVVMERGKVQNLFSPAAEKKIMLTVQNDEGHVSSTQMKQVQDLLKQEDLIQKVATPYGFAFKAPVTVHLAVDEEEYTKRLSDYNTKELASQGIVLKGNQPYEVQREINILGRTTSSEMIRNDIFLNMNKMNSDPTIRGNIMGQLTKIMFDQNDVLIGRWIEEGLATHVEYEETYRGNPQALAAKEAQNVASILKSKQQLGIDMRLSGSGVDMITEQYDQQALEWMATDELLKKQGVEKVKQFIKESQASNKQVEPFDHVFGEPESLFRLNFLAQLDAQVKQSKKM